MLTYFHPEAVKRFLKTNNIEKESGPSLIFLEKLGKAFQKMPYENLTKLIRSHTIGDTESRIRLPELLFDEFLRYGTGGTCFSMTYFLQTILRSCGFDTYPVMADRPLAPNTHCASIVRIGSKKYLLDPGFMIDRQLELTRIPTRHDLRHNVIVIGEKGTVKIPPHQQRRFDDYNKKVGEKIVLPYKSDFSTPHSEARSITFSSHYMVATEMCGKVDIRYYMKDGHVDEEEFLGFWLDSFNWPTLKNISITQATDKGYIYARNNFIRTQTKEGRQQENIKRDLETIFGKTFGIDMHIITAAFEIIREVKRRDKGNGPSKISGGYPRAG